MTYRETLELLYSLMPDFQKVGAEAYKPGLERIESFVAYLGNPDMQFQTIHVAGTNGKGSVSHILTSVLMSAGYRVGLYTSPHLKDFRERIKVNGEMISEEEVINFTKSHLGKMGEYDLSFFEATVGMAFDHFAEQKVDVVVVETGLGGRLDATNIITPKLSVITNIALEHTSFLGDTIESIAREKGGIIKNGLPVVVGQRDDVSERVFSTISAERNAPLRFAEERYRVVDVEQTVADDGGTALRSYHIEHLPDGRVFEVSIDLLGDYQDHNIITALSAIELLNDGGYFKIEQLAVKDGLRKTASQTGLKGRWQILSHAPLMVADSGHNPDGIREVVRQIERCQYGKLYIVFGVANDKDLRSIIPLLPKDAHYIFTRASIDRAMSVDELAATAKSMGVVGETCDTVSEAVERAKSLATRDDMIFVGGSSFVVAELDL